MISKSITYKIYLHNCHFIRHGLISLLALFFFSFHLPVILHASEMDGLLSQTHKAPNPTSIPYKQRCHYIAP